MRNVSVHSCNASCIIKNRKGNASLERMNLLAFGLAYDPKLNLVAPPDPSPA